MNAPAELQRVVAADRADGLDLLVEADAAERAAVAARLGLPAVLALSCRFRLVAAGSGFAADGRLRARVVQTCVVTLDEFEAEVDEPFRLRFVPDAAMAEDIDWAAEEDEVPFGPRGLDLGEATVEQLALALDPYPRKPGAALPDEAQDAEAGPFAALGKLQRPQ
jgi:uncharacterized metal-binding protein YceD (DUF177 family)